MTMRYALLSVLVAFGSFAQPAGWGMGGDPKINGVCPPFTPTITPSALGNGCACAAITDSHGIPITDTRASAGLCADAGFAPLSNGDVVSCGNNLPRVMGGGILVEGQRNNLAKDTTMNNGGVWQLWSSGGPAVPTETQNYATNPYGGASSAPRLQFPSCAATNSQSVIFNSVTPGGSPASGQVWVRSNTGSNQTVSVCLLDDAANGTCAPLTVDAGAWTLATNENFAYVTPPLYLEVGCVNSTAISGHSNTGAADVLLWGGQIEDSAAFVSSPITTTAAATATRSADVASMPDIFTGENFSGAITWTYPRTTVNDSTAFQVYFDANNSITAHSDGSRHLVCDFKYNGSTYTATTTAAMSVSSTNRVACVHSNSTINACINGVCDSNSASKPAPVGAATIYLGTRSASGNEAWGVVKDPCFSSSSSRCM